MRWIVRVIIYLILSIAIIRYIERKYIFYPMKEVELFPDSAGLKFEDVYFRTQDNKRLNAWFIPAENASLTVLFSHGNAGNLSHRIEKASMLAGLGLNVFVYDYRGYGKSQGSPDERGFYKDISAAFDYLVNEKKIAAEKIILYGESIGGAAAIDLAMKQNAGAVIIEGTFTSIKDMARLTMPFIPYFVYSSRFDSFSKIKDIMAPKLIIHSIDDEIIPFSFGERLYSSALPPKKFLELRGSHNTAFLESKEEYINGIKAFLSMLN